MISLFTFQRKEESSFPSSIIEKRGSTGSQKSCAPKTLLPGLCASYALSLSLLGEGLNPISFRPVSYFRSAFFPLFRHPLLPSTVCISHSDRLFISYSESSLCPRNGDTLKKCREEREKVMKGPCLIQDKKNGARRKSKPPG